MNLPPFRSFPLPSLILQLRQAGDDEQDFDEDEEDEAQDLSNHVLLSHQRIPSAFSTTSSSIGVGIGIGIASPSSNSGAVRGDRLWDGGAGELWGEMGQYLLRLLANPHLHLGAAFLQLPRETQATGGQGRAGLVGAGRLDQARSG